MPRNSTKKILALLKEKGADLDADVLEAIQKGLDVIELDLEELLGKDRQIVATADLNGVYSDLKKLRATKNDLEKKVAELEETTSAGDSVHERNATKLRNRLDELEPSYNKLIKAESDRWASNVKTIPEELIGRFKAPADEDGELTLDELLSNGEKFREYSELGLLESNGGDSADEGPPKDPSGPPNARRSSPGRQGKGKLTREQMDGMSDLELIHAHYSE